MAAGQDPGPLAGVATAVHVQLPWGSLLTGLLTADAPPDAYHHTIPVIGLFATLARNALHEQGWSDSLERLQAYLSGVRP